MDYLNFTQLSGRDMHNPELYISRTLPTQDKLPIPLRPPGSVDSMLSAYNEHKNYEAMVVNNAAARMQTLSRPV